MDTKIVKKQKLHISELDDYLAKLYFEKNCTIRLVIGDYELDGNFNLFTEISDTVIKEEALDFELSACECSGLEITHFDEIKKSPIITSSAYDFFDYILSDHKEIECLISFKDSSWLIKIINIVD